MTGHTDIYKGLTAKEVEIRQEQYGRNELIPQTKQGFFHKAIHIVCEPMFLLLLLAAVIYFVLGEPRDGAIMLIFVVSIISIDIIQEWKTDKTLSALKDLSAPHITVIRDGIETAVASAELVPGDLMLLQEGIKVPADGIILKCNDLCVDESSLTGEAEGVWKGPADREKSPEGYWRKDHCYAGTLVIQGTAVVLVEKTGPATEYGKIGNHIAAAPDRPTPLERQTGSLVKLCAGIAAVLFALVGVFTYISIPDGTAGGRLIESILSGITLAMAMIPEEFPVILTVFLSMGAWRLARKQSLVRHLPAVETLGEVSVLCVDKTGTITVNQMTVQESWTAKGTEENLYEIMGLGCETETYDPMEKAMLSFCEEKGILKGHLFGGSLIREYSFTNELKMMGHVWHHDGEIIVACKGSPEQILSICPLSDEERAAAERKVISLSEKGLRVIAVGEMRLEKEEEIPEKITDCRLSFCGLIGLALSLIHI